jgi:two-component system OmpR family sensor kinase
MEDKLRVLMLEDRVEDAELNKFELRKGCLNFVSRCVETEEDFRKELAEFKPDIILSDYELPDFDGISALIISKSVEPEVPFIFVTGRMGEETAIEMLTRGATDYVLKNRLSRLVPAVQRALDEVEEYGKRKEAERLLAERAERLSHFLTVASHELRHPITVIKGYADILDLHEEEMTEKMVKDIYGEMGRAANRLTRLVEELMDVSIIEGRQFQIERQSVDVKSLCGEAIREMDSRGFQNEFSVNIKDNTSVNVDPEKFLEVIKVLLDNACIYSNDSSPVEIEAEDTGDIFTMTVSYRGPGVPETEKEQIFERFYQVVDALHHSKPGMGLGLYIAKQIVDAHGARIWCEPRDGGGTVFRVALKEVTGA